jgi:hypothetical protein
VAKATQATLGARVACFRYGVPELPTAGPHMKPPAADDCTNPIRYPFGLDLTGRRVMTSVILPNDIRHCTLSPWAFILILEYASHYNPQDPRTSREKEI